MGVLGGMGRGESDGLLMIHGRCVRPKRWGSVRVRSVPFRPFRSGSGGNGERQGDEGDVGGWQTPVLKQTKTSVVAEKKKEKIS